MLTAALATRSSPSDCWLLSQASVAMAVMTARAVASSSTLLPPASLRSRYMMCSLLYMPRSVLLVALPFALPLAGYCLRKTSRSP